MSQRPARIESPEVIQSLQAGDRATMQEVLGRLFQQLRTQDPVVGTFEGADAARR